jgi:cephalosporin-C deacetylase-like acetyl esterase
VLFFGSWAGQSVTGWSELNTERLEHGESDVSYLGYLARPEFWEDTLQNWQSEFLAVGTLAVFTIYLRQRGSPESKPVGAPHGETASSG